jgi:hypothetical protein
MTKTSNALPSFVTDQPITSSTLPLYQVTFGCRYSAIIAMKVTANSPDEAERIGKEIIPECKIQGMEDAPPSFVGGIYGTHLVNHKVLGVRPAENNGGFDLRDMDLRKDY